MLSSLSLANDGFLPRGIIAPLAYLSNGYLFNDRVLIPTLFRGLDSGFAANLYGSGYKNDTMLNCQKNKFQRSGLYRLYLAKTKLQIILVFLM